ncbi:MAG: class I tRNA ligase family protein, partial [Solirubrobacteraceae bacterium]
LHQTIQKVTADLDEMRFNTAIAAMMEYTNHLTPLPVRPRPALEPLVLLLSPFAPHLAEELWRALGHAQSLAYEPWPAHDPELAREDEVEVPVQVNGKVKLRLTVPAGLDNAALEAIVLGLPGIAVSQQSNALELDFRTGAGFEFRSAATFTSRLVAELGNVPLPTGTLLNINVPGAEPSGVEVARLGKRVYRDELALVDEATEGRRLYRIYGDASFERDETGTDLQAVSQGKIAVTPIHFDLTDREGLTALQRYDLARLVAPAAREMEV